MIPARVNLPRSFNPSIVAALILLAACGDKKPPTPPPPGPTAETITGRERFGWIQAAGSTEDLAIYKYALYVDGQRRVIEGETCTPAAGGTSADCSAPLPTLTAGRHTLEVAALFLWDGAIIEGQKSVVLEVILAGAVAPAGPATVRGGALLSSDGLRLHADIVARDFTDPVDVAVSADGRVFVAERGGRIRAINGRSEIPIDFSDDNVLLALRETPGADGTAVRSLALTPDFPRSGLMYAAYVTPDREGPVLRIARLRELGGVLGEAAVVASFRVPGPDVAALVRVGPDGKLYVGVGSGGDSRTGTILRLDADGRTPHDNPRTSPVFSIGHGDPRGFAWLPGDASVWEVERDEHGDEINRIQPGADYGWPAARGGDSRSAVTAAALQLPARSQPSGMAAVHQDTSPFFGELIVSTAGSEDLLRIRVDVEGRLRVQGRLLQRRFGRIGQVAAGADGALYVLTANQDRWGQGSELLIRLTPTGRPSERAR